MRVLIASQNNKLTESILRSVNLYLPGNELITTKKISKYIRINRNKPADLLIIDLDLIEEDKYDAFDIIKNASFSPDKIIISLYSTKPSMIKAFNLGSTQCILKPFDELELIACIKAILRNKKNYKVSDKIACTNDKGKD
jgi:DNA-binding response OmpR family regulator